MTTPLLTVSEAAELLRVSTARAYALIRAGVIPAIRLGRQVRLESGALESFIQQGGRSLEVGTGT